MKTTLIGVALATGSLVPGAFSQAAPGFGRPPAPSRVFDVASPTFKAMGSIFAIGHVAFRRLATDAPGTVTASVTVDLPSVAGPRTWDVVLGTFDLTTRSFVPNRHAVSFNGNDHDYGLQLEPGLGRYAVVDRTTLQAQHGGVWFAQRSDASQPFGAPVQVRGLVGTGTRYYAHPALGYVGGKLKLFYVAVIGFQGIFMVDLDIANPAQPTAVGTPVLVVGPVNTGAVHSPYPLVGPDGDVEGLVFAEARSTGGDSDTWFANDLDPATPPVLMVDTPLWLAGGSFAGGYFAVGDEGNQTVIGPYSQTSDGEATWMLGDVEPPGGTVDLFGGASDLGGQGQVFTLAFAAVKLATSPISVPGIHGRFALGLAPNPVPLQPPLSHDQNGEGSMSFTIPNNPALSGFKMAIQGLTFQPATGTSAFTNTAWIKVR